MLTSADFIYIALFAASMVAAILKKLTIPGAVAGFVVGICVFEGGKLTALAELAAFFVLGSWSTAVGFSRKQAVGLAEGNKGSRTPGQVLANGGVAALLGLWFFITSHNGLAVTLMTAGSLAAATADTLSSELGNIYGKSFYNIITFKKDTRGLDGVISLEGTLAGVAGALIIAVIYFAFTGYLIRAIFVLIAGIIGTLMDSVLGATLERRGWLSNNWVNFLNTLTGAATAGLLYAIFE